MSSRREFLAAISSIPAASMIGSVEEVPDVTTSLIVRMKEPLSMHQISQISHCVAGFNKKRVEAGHSFLPVLMVDDSSVIVEQVQK